VNNNIVIAKDFRGREVVAIGKVLWRPFETMSNGEQTKALLAALFLKEEHFLLIDEPTNHLDVEGRRQMA
ncbi:ATP-binding cassette domain-containing protein, partial [Anaerofustis stercorihominis]|uniref:ATP-binding cassette domain-containing protein n=1 Tax=Anaerofustis stercorihominis TaxID=214853 RepID=UPI00210BC1AB